MRRLLLVPALALALPAHAQLTTIGAGNGRPPLNQGGVTYSGPGNIVASASFWGGLRGYSAAYAATGTGKSVNVRRASDNATQDIVILTTGAFDLASYNTFVGTDTTGSCTIASTTLTCSGLGSTLHVNDPISGAGIGQPCYLTAIGSFSAGAQTATINSAAICGAVGVAVTVTAQVAGLLPKLYDQSGALACTGSTACDVPQATAGKQPLLLPNCLNSLPCMMFAGSSTQYFQLVTFPATAQPVSASAVAQRNGALTTKGQIISTFTSGSTIQNIFYTTSNNQIGLYAGSTGTATASDNVWHAIQSVVNGASPASVLSVDNTETTVSSGAGATGISLAVGWDTGTEYMTGPINEAGIWFAAFTGTQRTNMCHNQYVYWGTPTSC